MRKTCILYLVSCILSACGGGNLALLKDGQQLFYDGQYSDSDAKFEQFNKKNINPTRTSLGAEAATLVAGARVNDYKPYMMDELFVSYYQLLDALALGNFDTARVIINQSYARQQSMSREYSKLIDDNKKEKGSKVAEERVSQDYSEWTAYKNIMNPALTYLAGLYFLNTAADNDDWENARLYLSRAAGMSPNNPFIKEDLELASARKHPANIEWTIIETGFAPKLVEEKMTLPWLIGRGPMLISFAVSNAVSRDAVQPPTGAVLLADVDAMFMTEYKQYRINEILRAAVKTAADVALQAALNEQSPWLGLGAAVYSFATTRAETRSWDTLPKKIYLLRKTNAEQNELIYIRDSSIKTILFPRRRESLV